MSETPKSNQTRKYLIRCGLATGFILLLVILVANGRGDSRKLPLGFSDKSPETTATAPTSKTGAPQRAPLETLKVTSTEESEVVRLTGTLEADETAHVASQASGIVQRVFVDLGSNVQSGDPLVQLDPVDAQNALAEGEGVAKELRMRLGLDKAGKSFDPVALPDVRAAQGSLDLAAANYKRGLQLQKEKIISQAEFDKMKMDNDGARDRYDMAVNQAKQMYQSYQTAETRLVALRRSIDKTLVKAPFSGMVAEKKVSMGERVEPAMGNGVVVTLVKMDPLRLTLTVPQQYSGLVKEGQIVEFELDGSPGRTFKGKVACIGPALDAVSRSLKAEALVDNANRELRPGLFATAQLQLPTKKTVLSVPSSAVLRSADSSKVYVLRQGIAQAQLVGATEMPDGKTQITSGLSKDDVIVANPAQAQDGVKVQ